jgi:hypothetical protein
MNIRTPPATALLLGVLLAVGPMRLGAQAAHPHDTISAQYTCQTDSGALTYRARILRFEAPPGGRGSDLYRQVHQAVPFSEPDPKSMTVTGQLLSAMERACETERAEIKCENMERSVVHQVLVDHPALLSIETTTYEYMCGAHGLPGVSIAVYDGDSGRRLRVSDFVDGGRAALLPVAEEHFRRQLDIGPTTPWAKTNYAFPEGFELPRNGDEVNFFASPEGLHFVYNVYEIAPYVGGQIEFMVPWEAVEDKLRGDKPWLAVRNAPR